jgi:hypothetical protein
MDPGYSFLASLESEFRDDEAERLRFNLLRCHVRQAGLASIEAKPNTRHPGSEPNVVKATLSGIHSVTMPQHIAVQGKRRA